MKDILSFLIKKSNDPEKQPKHKYSMPITASLPRGYIGIGCGDDYCMKVVLWVSLPTMHRDLCIFKTQEEAMNFAEGWVSNQRAIMSRRSIRQNIPALIWKNDDGIVNRELYKSKKSKQKSKQLLTHRELQDERMLTVIAQSKRS